MRIGKCLIAMIVAVSLVATLSNLPVRAEESLPGVMGPQVTRQQVTLPTPDQPTGTTPASDQPTATTPASDLLTPTLPAPEETIRQSTVPMLPAPQSSQTQLTQTAPQSSQTQLTQTAPQTSLSQPSEPQESTVLLDAQGPDEIVPDLEVLTHYVRTMDDLVAALGAGNVAVSSSTTLRVISGIDTTPMGDVQIVFEQGTYDIDFQGHQVRLNRGIVINGGSVTLRDSSEYPYGGLTANVWDASGANRYVGDAVLQYGGELTIESGYYSSSVSALSVQGGTVRINGGEFAQIYSSNVGGKEAAEIRSGNATITAGVFRGSYAGLALWRTSTSVPPATVRISGGLYLSTGEGGANFGGIYIENSFDVEGTPHLSDVLAANTILLPGNEKAVFMGIASESEVIAVQTIGAEGFVYRLYAVALGRSPDYYGYRNWLLLLKDQDITGSQAAYGFVFSTEMNERNLSDQDFIAILYDVFLQRTPDQTGMNYWLDALATGVSREFVFTGFANSAEWKSLCGRFGIAPGTFEPTESRDKNFKVTQFVSRLYRLCLRRPADVGGLNYWTGDLIGKTSDGAHVAWGFFFSREMANRNLSHGDFVDLLYQVLLGRTADVGGQANWVAQLESGTSRYEIFKGFAHSAEFTAICESYGITRGSVA